MESGVNTGLLSEAAELGLHEAMQKSRSAVAPLLERRSYTEALELLAGLREPVDRFFDDVMVMADDEAVRNNRLALLAELRLLFLDIADISRLTPVQE
jgi:glycyl-tRNA synthetase beta chain